MDIAPQFWSDATHKKNTSRGTAFAKAAIRQAQALNKGMGTSPALTNTVCV